MNITMSEADIASLEERIHEANEGMPWKFSNAHVSTDNYAVIAIFFLDVGDGICVKAQSDTINGIGKLYAIGLEGPDEKIMQCVQQLYKRLTPTARKCNVCGRLLASFEHDVCEGCEQ